jgi:hypothetical protein
MNPLDRGDLRNSRPGHVIVSAVTRQHGCAPYHTIVVAESEPWGNRAEVQADGRIITGERMGSGVL